MRYLEQSDTETGSRTVVVRGWEEGEIGSQCFKGEEFQFCKMERVLEMNDG